MSRLTFQLLSGQALSSVDVQLPDETAERIAAMIAREYPAGGAPQFFTTQAGDIIDRANRSEAQAAAEAAAAAVEPTRPAWGPGIWLARGAEVVHEAQVWVTLQTHLTQSDWAPPLVPALFALLNPPPAQGNTAWVAGEQVQINDEREYEGILYRCLQPHTTQVGWHPPAVPALWAVV